MRYIELGQNAGVDLKSNSKFVELKHGGPVRDVQIHIVRHTILTGPDLWESEKVVN